jgi:hypothetical protein
MKAHRPLQQSPARGAAATAPRSTKGGDPRGGRGNGFLQEQLARSVAPSVEEPGSTGAETSTATLDAGAREVDASRAPTRAAGQVMDTADTDRLYRAVRGTARGASLVAALSDRPLPELSWSGQGSYMLGDNVWLDLELPESDIVDVLVHELQHVVNAREGRTGDIGGDDRATYVDKTLEDESWAQGAMIVHGLQAGGEGIEAKVFKAHLQSADPSLAAAVSEGRADVDWARVEALARAYARTQFEETYRTSTTGERYPDYYGGSWDRAHPEAKDGKNPRNT